MNKLILSLFLISTFTYAAEPIATPVPTQAPFPFPLVSSAIKIENGEYHLVENSKMIKANGQQFVKFVFQKQGNVRYDPIIANINQSCRQETFDSNSPFLKPAFVAANLGLDVLAAYEITKVDWDKEKHFLAGYVVGNLTSGGLQLILPKDTPHRKLKIFLGGFAASTIVGVGKELADYYGYGHVKVSDGHLVFSHGTPSANDAIATALGGITGSITFSIVDLKNFRKPKDKIKF